MGRISILEEPPVSSGISGVASCRPLSPVYFFGGSKAFSRTGAFVTGVVS